uniref:Smr domain-containing protein n=1 Tax=Plectus sambesii TaxID=2011161 RepID=A0A914VSP5_9BILA
MELWWPLLVPFVVIIITIICLIYRCCCTSTERRNARRDPLNRDHEKGILSDELATELPEGSLFMVDFLKLNKEKNNNLWEKIDLHGLTRKQATIILKKYLPRPLSYGQSFEVVTGRGNNSPNGPVLFHHVKKELDAIYPRDWIRAVNKNGSWIITGGGASPQERSRR